MAPAIAVASRKAVWRYVCMAGLVYMLPFATVGRPRFMSMSRRQQWLEEFGAAGKAPMPCATSLFKPVWVSWHLASASHCEGSFARVPRVRAWSAVSVCVHLCTYVHSCVFICLVICGSGLLGVSSLSFALSIPTKRK